MPRSWHDRHAANKIEDDKTKYLYRSVVADKKPYFMRYIYPDLMRQYNSYIKKTNKSALREFGMTIQELQEIPNKDLTDKQRDFLYYFEYRLPVADKDCVMNKICRKVEVAFDGFVGRSSKSSTFDYTILKSGAEYTKSQKAAVQKLYDEYTKKIQSYAIFSKAERIDSEESAYSINSMKEEYRRECEAICPNEFSLCDILLDICYQKSTTKKFVWDMFSHVIVTNLLAKNDGMISYPCFDNDGDIEYCGSRFSIKESRIEVNE